MLYQVRHVDVDGDVNRGMSAEDDPHLLEDDAVPPCLMFLGGVSSIGSPEQEERQGEAEKGGGGGGDPRNPSDTSGFFTSFWIYEL